MHPAGDTTAPTWAARRPYLASCLLAGVAATLVGVIAVAEDLPIRDPDGVAGSPAVRLSAILAFIFLADVVPRALARRRERGGLRPALVCVLRERWSPRRAVPIMAGLLTFYVVYLSYRNLKGFLPFLRDDLTDSALISLEHDVFGTHPATLMHDLLGTGVAAHVLSAVYVVYLGFVPVSLCAALVWSRDIGVGLWYATALNLNWLLGVVSYYLVPSLGPAFVRPDLFSGLPETGATALQDALSKQRALAVTDPHATDVMQGIAGFASLHVSVVLTAALVAQLVRAPRVLRRGLWIYLALTTLATIYFGWHFLVDDLGGVLIAVAAVWAGARWTGRRLRPSQKGDRHPEARRRRGHDGIDAIQRAAVRAERPTAVLDAEVALDERLGQVAQRRRHGDGRTQRDGLPAAEPVLPEARQPDDGDRGHQAGDDALHRLVRGHRGRELAAPDRGADQLRGGVAEEGPEQDVHHQPGPVLELAQHGAVREEAADPDHAEQRDGDRRGRSVGTGAHDGRHEHAGGGRGQGAGEAVGAGGRGRHDHAGDGEHADRGQRMVAIGGAKELERGSAADGQQQRHEGDAAERDRRNGHGGSGDGHRHPGAEIGRQAGADAAAHAVASSPLNLPNLLTLARIMLVPVLLVLVLEADGGSLAAAGVFALAVATDALDGHLARSRGLVTTAGKILDPLADKLLVGGALGGLVAIDALPAWVAVVVLGREAAVTVMRAVAGRRGLVVPASGLGKLKMAVQSACVLVLLAAGDFTSEPVRLLIGAMVAVTVASGVDYALCLRQRAESAPAGGAAARLPAR